MKTKPIEDFRVSDYDLIIFDCDGTLVDSEKLSNGLIAEMLREVGMDISNKEALDLFVGTSFANITQHAEAAIGKSLEFDFEAAFRLRSEKVFRAELKTIEGAIPFIENIDIPICIASNGPKVKMMLTLEITGLLAYFNKGNMFSAYDIEKWKPAPDLFLHAAKVMGCDPQKCLVVEDTIPGAMGAVNGEMDVIVIADSAEKEAFKRKQIPTFPSYKVLSETFSKR